MGSVGKLSVSRSRSLKALSECGIKHLVSFVLQLTNYYLSLSIHQLLKEILHIKFYKGRCFSSARMALTVVDFYDQ